MTGTKIEVASNLFVTYSKEYCVGLGLRTIVLEYLSGHQYSLHRDLFTLVSRLIPRIIDKFGMPQLQ